MPGLPENKEILRDIRKGNKVVSNVSFFESRTYGITRTCAVCLDDDPRQQMGHREVIQGRKEGREEGQEWQNVFWNHQVSDPSPAEGLLVNCTKHSPELSH